MMKTLFRLSWHKFGSPVARAFKHGEAHGLFSDYSKRIAKFAPMEVLGGWSSKEKRPAGRQTWICDRAKGARLFSSEDLARQLELLRDSGIRELEIVIGGPDGFSEEERQLWKPVQCWSFGPMTLPHELAVVVASEQIYRAWTILHKMPYHH